MNFGYYNDLRWVIMPKGTFKEEKLSFMKGKMKILIIIPFMVLVGLLVYRNQDKNIEAKAIAIKQSNTNIIDDKLNKDKISKLKKTYNNDDIKPYLEIDNTDYAWVIPQGSDNKFYLKHLLNKSYDHIGTPFLDCRVDLGESKKLLIYGHNSSKYEMPFKALENYYQEEYYKEHQIVTLTTDEGERKFQIFSVYVETQDFDYYNKIDFKNEKEYFDHLQKLKNKSLYDTGVEIKSDDTILILQTCSTKKEYLKYNKKFMLVIMKEVN